MPVKRILSGALAALLIAAIPARATSVPTFTLVDSIAPGADDSYAMAINQSVALGDYLYFVADTSTSGSELWRSNGTTTQLVKDINPGTPDSYPSNFAVLGDYLYFQANDGTHGVELWRTNGSEAGTTLVEDIFPGISASDPLALTVFRDYIYFQADDGVFGKELWRSNGTTTELAKDIAVGDSSASGYPYNFYVMEYASGDLLFFNASDGTTGNEPWVTDGTEAGTHLVKDIFGGSDSNPSEFKGLNGYVYFRADDGIHGSTELMRTDGTEAGTTLVKDIFPGTGAGNPSGFTQLGDYLYFQADDGTGNGVELHRTDGTEAGTTLVKDIQPGAVGSSPTLFTKLGEMLYFAAEGPSGWELWRTDGTEAGTTGFADIIPGAGDSYPAAFTRLGDYLYFSAYDVDRLGVWRTNGAVTENVPLPAGGGTLGTLECGDCYPQIFATVGSRLYSMTYSAAYGHEFAYLDEPTAGLPSTNGKLWIWTTAMLVILSGVTAAASIGLQVRGAKRA
jgi:ELWxxDGT repeat protein